MTTTTSECLPEEVLIDILSRLPVKTLIRLRCVCKSWYATITHPSFIIIHLNRVSSSHSDAYFQYMDSVPSDLRFLSGPISVDCSFKGFVSVYVCNGLVCLSNLFYSAHIIDLWNPSIRKFKTLPSSTIAPQLFNSKNYVVLGFGFHPQTNDYKVVRIMYFRDVNWKYIEEPPPQVEVYALSTDSWRKIDARVPCFPKVHFSNAFLNGSVHWVAFNSRKANKRGDMILSFDIGDEVFGEMMLPINYHGGSVMVRSWLAVLKGSLSLCVSFPNEDLIWTGRYYIWVMKEYGVAESWTKQFTIVVPDGVLNGFLGFTKKNELLLVTTNNELVSYDTESLRFKYHGVHGLGYKMKMIPFVETLVLLERGNALLGQENSLDGVNTEGIQLGKKKSRVICNYKQKGLKKQKVKKSMSRLLLRSKGT